MSKITKSARGKTCTVRIDGVCNYDAETTVFAHYRDLRLGCGVGLKPPDIFGCYACSSCHDALDGRIKTKYDKEQLRFEHMRAILVTQKILIDAGLIKI